MIFNVFKRLAGWALVAQLVLPAVALAGQAAAPAPQAPQAQDGASQPAANPPAAATPAAADPAAVQSPARAQPPAPMFASPAQPTPATGSLLQTILSLLFVLALVVALAWFLKRFGPRAIGGAANMRVIGSLSLGGRERVMVVEVADQWIVVGAAPGRVNVLATMPKQEGVEPPAPMAAGLPSGFADWLKQTIDKRNAK